MVEGGVMEQPKKYRAWFEAEGKESLMVDTDNPTGIIDMFIGFDDTEIGRGIWLPNLWDRMIIEKKQKSTYQSSEETPKTDEIDLEQIRKRMQETMEVLEADPEFKELSEDLKSLIQLSPEDLHRVFSAVIEPREKEKC